MQILSCNTDANKISKLRRVWRLLAHKHVIYFLFRKPGGGGVGLGGLNQIKQPRVADFFFAYPLESAPHGAGVLKGILMNLMNEDDNGVTYTAE